MKSYEMLAIETLSICLYIISSNSTVVVAESIRSIYKFYVMSAGVCLWGGNNFNIAYFNNGVDLIAQNLLSVYINRHF